jgi:hypothetical protein
LKSGKLAQQSCRYLAPALLSKLKVEIGRMVIKGILVPTDTATVSSLLVIVPKPDNSIRVAVDYRQLNDNIEPFGGNLPNMKSSFPYVAGNKYYGKMDNLWGYHQLLADSADQDLTTIITPFGLFKFTRCPFGISTAPGVYQDRMSNVILKISMYQKQLFLSTIQLCLANQQMNSFLH